MMMIEGERKRKGEERKKREEERSCHSACTGRGLLEQEGSVAPACCQKRKWDRWEGTTHKEVRERRGKPHGRLSEPCLIV